MSTKSSKPDLLVTAENIQYFSEIDLGQLNDFPSARTDLVALSRNLPPFVGDGVYAVRFYEVAKMFNAPGVSKLPNDGAAGLIAKTAIGPLFVGGSVGDTGHATWFFALGRVF